MTLHVRAFRATSIYVLDVVAILPPHLSSSTKLVRRMWGSSVVLRWGRSSTGCGRCTRMRSGPRLWMNLWRRVLAGQDRRVVGDVAAQGPRSVRHQLGCSLRGPCGGDGQRSRAEGSGHFVADPRPGRTAARHGRSHPLTPPTTPQWRNGPPRAGPGRSRLSRCRTTRPEGLFTPNDPDVYVKLLKAAYPGFKAGNPDVLVLPGGPSYVDTGWSSKMYASSTEKAPMTS